MQKKVAGKVFGCKVNQVELDALLMMFAERNFEIVDFNEKADVYIVHTCAVTHISEGKARHAIRQIKQEHPRSILVVSGCYAQTSVDELKLMKEIDILLGTADRKKMLDAVIESLDEAKNNVRNVKHLVREEKTEEKFEEIYNKKQSDKKTRFFLKIQDGCENFCSYCIIPYARGVLKSRNIKDILWEANQAALAGYKEIVVTGINVAAYGFEKKSEKIFLNTVLEELLAVEGIERIRISSIESTEILPQVVELIKNDSRFCRQLHIPLQAGSDIILKAMRRNYSVHDFTKVVCDIRASLPDISLTTDIIVGFPGESEEIFNNSLYAIENMCFSKIHVFPYSPRKGTLAAGLPGQINNKEKKLRVKKIIEVSNSCALKIRESFLGNKRKVLFESGHEGLTDNYFRVYLKNNNDSLRGNIADVVLQELYKDGFWGYIDN